MLPSPLKIPSFPGNHARPTSDGNPGIKQWETQFPIEAAHVTAAIQYRTLDETSLTLFICLLFGFDISGMLAMHDAVRDFPVRQFAEGEMIIAEGTSTGLLFVLIEGAVQVLKDDVVVATSSEPGAIFGDLSVLLHEPHTAAVRALRATSFHVISDPRAFLETNPAVCLHLCELLARRLDAVNKYLVNVKHQFAGHDHLGMVDGALDTLMHRQPKKRIAPRASTLRDPEIAD